MDEIKAAARPGGAPKDPLPMTENRFRSIADTAPVLMWIADASRYFTWFNRTWLDYTGRDLAEERGEGWMGGVHPEDRDRSLTVIRDAFDARGALSTEFRLRGRDGEYQWFVINATPLKDGPDSSFSGFIGACTNISERKAHEQALALSEARFRNMILQVKDYAIYATDREGRALSWNEGVQAVFGYTEQEFVGTPVELPFLPEDIAADVPSAELQVAREKGVANDDRWLLRKDRTRFYARGRTTRLTNSAGEWIGFSKVMRDETQNLLAQERILQSEGRYRTLVQNVRDYAIFMLDSNRRVTEWTEGAEKVKGYAPEEILGRHVSVFYIPEDIAAGEVEREFAEATATGRVEREGWRVRADGVRIWVNEIATAIRSSAGALVGFTKISRDLTRQRLAEAAQRESDRRKDEFLATLAHELRNPLAPLRNGLQIVRMTEKGDRPFQRAMEMMDRQLTHLVHLVDDLLDVARISSGKVVLREERVDLKQVIARSAEASAPALEAHGHQLAVEVSPEHLCVNGDFDRLAQVFSNLLSNAAKYTDSPGQIRITAAREDREVVVRVIDSGIGIPATDLPQVFDLFSQVREHQGRSEGGLGIGLSLVKRFVTMHHGSVTAESAGTGKGSTFTVRLPIMEPDS